MTFDELKSKAQSLPQEPGIYIMRNGDNEVIYVGKAKKLKNRVTQYFQDTASHTTKTKIMVSKIHDFDVIIAASEFEALVLECATIKRYMPRYNILLKDGKGYPYVRLNQNLAYPTVELVNKIVDDGALYFGPFGSRGTTQNIINAIRTTLKLPNCSKKFPRDIGKERPCLNFDMNLCAGWCRKEKSKEEYLACIDQAKLLLSGNYKKAAQNIREKMLAAAESLEFEVAASLRDSLVAVESLGTKQLVTALSNIDMDVVGYAQNDFKACFSILHYHKGDLVEKDYEFFQSQEDPEAAVSSLIKQYYFNRGVAPKIILIPFPIEDGDLFSDLMLRETGRRPYIHSPQKGDKKRLVDIAVKNASEELKRISEKEDRQTTALRALGKMLAMDPPMRIESFDISNTGSCDIVASMVVFERGKPRKSEYRRFRIEGLGHPDDYASMRQVILRRFQRWKDEAPEFIRLPDILLIDGGLAHARVAQEVLSSFDLSIPVIGMVKDDRHRTRALVTPQGEQIQIAAQPSVFAFIGTIQEETHRFAINYNKKLRSNRLKYSQLDKIPGIGPKRKQDLLHHFKSISNIAVAELSDLERIVPRNAALAVYEHFHKNNQGEETP